MSLKKINVVVRESKELGTEVMVASNDVKELELYIEGLVMQDEYDSKFHIIKDVRFLEVPTKKIDKGIMCGHKDHTIYSSVEGTEFYGDLCEDCMIKHESLLVFENTNEGPHISDITIKPKFDDWDIFSRIVIK